MGKHCGYLGIPSYHTVMMELSVFSGVQPGHLALESAPYPSGGTSCEISFEAGTPAHPEGKALSQGPVSSA